MDIDIDWIRPALDAAQREDGELWPDEAAALVVAGPRLSGGSFSPAEHWAALARLLMQPWPSHGLEALRVTGVLRAWLPEVHALFGVPQLCDGPEPIDVGLHQLRVVDVAAHEGLPLAVRFAALMHKIGKGGTPRDIWPSHYKHEQRALALLEGLGDRFAVPEALLDLSRLVVLEADRVHRVSDMRAGAMAAMLERLDAVGQPERFSQLLDVCTCDHAAHPGHHAADYIKAPRLRAALHAYVGVPDSGQDADTLLSLRAEAIAQAMGSMGRWAA